MHGSRREGAGERARRWPSRKATSGWKAPAWRSAMLECGPPTEHRSGAEMRLLADGSYHLAVGSTEMGNGSATSHRQIAAAVLGSRASQIAIVNANTDRTPYDTGTFASTGTVVAGQAVALAAAALRDNILDYAGRHGCVPRGMPSGGDAVICGNRRIPLAELHAAGSADRPPLRGESQGLPVAAHGRVQRARHPACGASRHRRDPHPAQRARRRHRAADQSDAVPRPDRRRHRHGLRLGAHREHGARRRTARWSTRACATTAFPPSPTRRRARSFRRHLRTIGPLGAKAQGECAINPVAPAIANALADATGVRFGHLPFTPDRIFAALSADG